MGCEEHELFTLPEPDAHLWRYVDFIKYVAMLEAQALHFPRADLLSDPFEGSLSVQSRQYRQSFEPEAQERAEEGFRSLRRHTHISCWHVSEVESAAMWRLYAGRGVALCTNYADLCASLSTMLEVYVGVVRYIDYELEHMPGRDNVSQFLHKRNSFVYEAEVRAIIQDFNVNTDENGAQVLNLDGSGPAVLEVPADLNRMLNDRQAVYVAPEEPVWFHHLVEDVTRRYGLGVPVLQSDLRREPIF